MTSFARQSLLCLLLFCMAAILCTAAVPLSTPIEQNGLTIEVIHFGENPVINPEGMPFGVLVGVKRTPDMPQVRAFLITIRYRVGSQTNTQTQVVQPYQDWMPFMWYSFVAGHKQGSEPARVTEVLSVTVEALGSITALDAS